MMDYQVLEVVLVNQVLKAQLVCGVNIKHRRRKLFCVLGFIGEPGFPGPKGLPGDSGSCTYI